MGHSVYDFAEEFPEFAHTDEGKVRRALVRAEADVSEVTFAESWDQAVMLLAAHDLRVGPMTHTSTTKSATPAKNGEPTTKYLEAFDRLVKRRVIPFMVSG